MPSRLGQAIAMTVITTTFGMQAAAGPQRQGPGHHNPGYVNQDTYTSDNIYEIPNLAYYGNWDSNQVFVIDVDNMALVKIVEDTGEGPYGIDQQGPSKAYALTRKTESLTVVDNYSIENMAEIPLQHKPRSTNFNANTGLSIVSGGDKAMTSIIRVDHDKVTKVIGYDELSEPHDFGGSLATGHPLWVGDQRFFMLDRASRQIQLWNRKGELLSVLATPTSVHHIFQSPLELEDGIYYAVAEGNQDEGISPSILRFKIKGKKMRKTGEAVLADFDKELLDPAKMGVHHADFHPDGVYIYVGSAEGHLFVIDKDSMEIQKMIETGAGSGHTTFAPMHNLAFVTNHNDTYMTVIDTSNHTWLKNIEVASSASPDYKSQAHTSGVSPDMKYFYSAASHDGVFFEIDLDTLEVSRTLYLGGNVLMGSFIWDGDGVNM
jgi:DNA-binding beta-propeller fold protein YncE